MGLMFSDSSAFVGYTLFAPMPYEVAYLINNEGRKVNEWAGTYQPALSANLLEDGRLLRTCRVGNARFNGGGAGGRLELVDWNGLVSWVYMYSTQQHCQHHDAIGLPSGSILFLAWEYKTRQQCLDAGRNPNLLFYNSLWPDHLVEVDTATDSIVWEWHVWDHLVQDYSAAKPNYGVVAEHPELINLNYVEGQSVADWNHCNAVAFSDELDQVIISSRQFSEIWVVDHSTTTEEARGHSGGRYGKGGDLLYRWGNPQAYDRGNTIGQTSFGQHDAHWIAPGLPGAGHILLFNNGLGRATPPYSSVDEIVPPMDSAGFYHLGPDSAYGPAAPAWSYVAPNPPDFYSSIISGCERMPNGNTLICDGTAGQLFEVKPDSGLAWRYISPVTQNGPQYQGDTIRSGTNQVFKVRRYAPDFAGFIGRSMIPGDPVELYPQSVAQPHSPGAKPDRIRISPNPARKTAKVSFSSERSAPFTLDVYDAAGCPVLHRHLAPGARCQTLDLRQLSAGVYLVKGTGDGVFAAKRLVIAP